MADVPLILKELHRLRRHVRDLQTELERGPRLLKAQQARAAQGEQTLQSAKDQIQKLKVTSRDRENAYKTTQQQLAKYRQQLNTVQSKKEMEALQHEIADTTTKSAELESEALQAMMDAEEQTTTLPKLEQVLKDAQAALANFDRENQARMAQLTQQLQQAQTELAGVEQQLSGDVKLLYERLVAAHGADALSAVKNRNCTTCYTAITAQNYNDLLGGRFVICKSCGRALYLSE